MKALTIYGIYADCTAAGVKTVEWRSWKTNYRGELLICANALNPPEWRDLFITRHAICTVQLADCVTFTKEHHVGYYYDNPPNDGYAWLLENVQFIKPVQIKGKQRIFNVDIMPEYLGITYNEARQYWFDEGLVSAVDWY